MFPTTYTIQRGDKFNTIRTCGGAVGAALGMYPELRKQKVSWKELENSQTLVNECVLVTAHKL